MDRKYRVFRYSMHVGIIMDGNRRWAKAKNLPTLLGHAKGAKNIEKVIKFASKNGASIITLYILSTENLVNRTKKEILTLMTLIADFAANMRTKLIKQDVCVTILGDITDLPSGTKTALQKLVLDTQNCLKVKLQICVNYGGRDEIVRSVRRLIKENKEINEQNISKSLDSPSSPDLIIRTGGNKRLSNFLTWQSAYSELYFTDVLWPDFDEPEYQKALAFFHSENRNFGK